MSQWPKPAPQIPPKRRSQSLQGQKFRSGKRRVGEGTDVRVGSCQRNHETRRSQTLRHRYGITSGQRDGKLRSKPPSTFALLSAAGSEFPSGQRPTEAGRAPSAAYSTRCHPRRANQPAKNLMSRRAAVADICASARAGFVQRALQCRAQWRLEQTHKTAAKDQRRCLAANSCS